MIKLICDVRACKNEIEEKSAILFSPPIKSVNKEVSYMYTLLHRYYRQVLQKLTLDTICQLSIALTGAGQAWLFTRADIELSTLGCVVGLIGAPFWFYTSFKNKQYGIFIVAIWYTVCFIDGLTK